MSEWEWGLTFKESAEYSDYIRWVMKNGKNCFGYSVYDKMEDDRLYVDALSKNISQIFLVINSEVGRKALLAITRDNMTDRELYDAIIIVVGNMCSHIRMHDESGNDHQINSTNGHNPHNNLYYMEDIKEWKDCLVSTYPDKFKLEGGNYNFDLTLDGVIMDNPITEDQKVTLVTETSSILIVWK
jgi:hypothetical protein